MTLASQSLLDNHKGLALFDKMVYSTFINIINSIRREDVT